MREQAPIYQAKPYTTPAVKTTPSIYGAATPSLKPTPPNTLSETPKADTPTYPDFTLANAQKALRAFAQQLNHQGLAELLTELPSKLKDAQTLQLYVPQKEQENAISSILATLNAHFQHTFGKAEIKVHLQKPYTDRDKLDFLSMKYDKVSELVSKLGLDLT